MEEAEIAPAIDSASENGDQSDARYALMLARSRASKGYGPYYVSQELASKGVARDLIKLTLASEEIDWEKALERASRSGSREPDASPSKEALVKLKAKLARRGF